MRIDVQPQLLLFIADFLAPDCRERQEEPLFRREAVDLFVSFFGVFLERFLQRSIRELDSADVGDVLALSERPIYVQAWQRFVFVVLINNRLRALLEFFAGLSRPPIWQISDFVV